MFKHIIALTSTLLLGASRANTQNGEGSLNFELYDNVQDLYNQAPQAAGPAVQNDLMSLLRRHQKFSRPPHGLERELAFDDVHDQWERDHECYYDQEHCDRTVDDQPVIGILTQPVSKANRVLFDYDTYILEINDNFIRWAGSRTVAIPYNIPEEELAELLPQLNGALFTGGGLELITPEGEQHPYYATAKRIFQYSKFMKDVKSEDWPLIGICQGHEVVSVILGDDNIDTLDNVKLFGRRPVHWLVDPQQTQVFKTFPEGLTDRMTQQSYALHAHSFAISMSTYNKTPGLKSFMTVTSVDTLQPENITFIDSMEAKHYPIYTTMYHPEYMISKTGDNDEMAFRLSLKVNRDARQNSNAIEGDEQEFFAKWGVSRVPAHRYGDAYTLGAAYGYDEAY